MAQRTDGYEKQIALLAGKLSDELASEIKSLFKKGIDPSRFNEIVSAMVEKSASTLPQNFKERLFKDIFSFAVSKVMDLRVAFLGPEGTFSSIAMREFFGQHVEAVAAKTISDVFSSVESGSADFGIVPIENSTEGAVSYTLDELIDTDLLISAEKYVRITLVLASKSGDPEKIKKIYSHPQPLGQCKQWLRNNFPGSELVSVESTTLAGELALKEKTSAAVLSFQALERLGLKPVAEGIEDLKMNYTRFFVIGHNESTPTGNDKTSIVCSVKDKPGALFDLLQPFRESKINLTKIESRPDKKKLWEYNFFIDFKGHRNDRKVRNALAKMREETLFLKILGSYPVGN